MSPSTFPPPSSVLSLPPFVCEEERERERSDGSLLSTISESTEYLYINLSPLDLYIYLRLSMHYLLYLLSVIIIFALGTL
jgi:hypothetical protein